MLFRSFFGVTSVSTANYIGFVAVGKGQEPDYSTGVTQLIDVGLVFNSVTGSSWNQVSTITNKGLKSVTANDSLVVAVGEDGVIYTSLDGTNWNGITQVKVISVNGGIDVLNVARAEYFNVGDKVRFSHSFNVIETGVDYYIVSIDSSTTAVQGSDFEGGGPIDLNAQSPITATYMDHYPPTDTLLDVAYANSMFVAVGENGRLITSSDGYTWIEQDSTTTERLTGISYNNVSDEWIVVGDNNTIITSLDGGTTWENAPGFVTNPPTYTVQGDEFLAGYGPEELVPGVVTDNITMIVNTLPGTDWSAVKYANVGYDVVSIELTPTSGTQLEYS